MAISDEQKKQFQEAEFQLQEASKKLQDAINQLGGMTKIKASKDGFINGIPIKVVLTDSAKMVISFRDENEAQKIFESL